jgi:hypothetical protein
MGVTVLSVAILLTFASVGWLWLAASRNAAAERARAAEAVQVLREQSEGFIDSHGQIPDGERKRIERLCRSLMLPESGLRKSEAADLIANAIWNLRRNDTRPPDQEFIEEACQFVATHQSIGALDSLAMSIVLAECFLNCGLVN